MPVDSSVQEKHRLYVTKRKVKVRVELLNATILTGWFYADQKNNYGGPGRVSERLNNILEPFIPLAVEDRHILVRKEAIAVIQLENEPWEAPQPSSNTVELRLRVRLMNGTTTRGQIHAVLPRNRARALDYLNDANTQFLALKSGADRVTLVNTAQIETVTEFFDAES